MSTIVTDTLQGKTSATSITLPTTTNIGSTPLVSASANSMTIRGEGSAVTNIQQGLVKCWCNFKGDGTVAIRDSFNFSSVSDQGTGIYDLAITNSMANNDYYYGSLQRVNSVTQGVAGEADLETGRVHDHKAFSTFNTLIDRELQGGLIAGDLA